MVCQVGLDNFDLDDLLFNSFIKVIIFSVEKSQFYLMLAN